MRRWFKTLVVCLVSLLALGAASGFWWVWNTERMEPGSSGQWLTASNGFQFRLDGMHTVSEIPGYGDQKTPAMAGATFVSVDISARAPHGDVSSLCNLRLIGTGNNVWWEYTNSPFSAYQLCSNAKDAAETDAAAIASGTIHFEVPDSYLEQVIGVAIQLGNKGLDPTPMLVP
ncbi:MAG: hypothetical protein FWG47_00950 [Propionibacteriaceae bacterium]|nr:hypothetical protein [Propionibacteriaceae bacterium]